MLPINRKMNRPMINDSGNNANNNNITTYKIIETFETEGNKSNSNNDKTITNS